jgi:DNA (cytosine-5)-methyltransferase 1
LLSRALSTSDRERHYVPQPAQKRVLQPKAFIGDLDTAVLKKENINRTTVTPSIFALAWGRVHEKLDIIGPPYHPPNKAEKESQKREAFLRLRRLVTKAKGPNPTDWSKDERISPTSDFLKSAIVGGEKYEVSEQLFFGVFSSYH